MEALRYLVSQAATITDGGRGEDKVLMVCDVARAFFEAKATRNMCVELPEEDLTEEEKGQDLVGLLKKNFMGPAMQPPTGRRRLPNS